MAKISTLNLVDRASRGAVLTVLDRTAPRNDEGEYPPIRAADGTPATLTLLGSDSPQARRLSYRRRADLQSRAMTVALSGKKRSFEESPDEVARQDASELDKAVALTTAWHGFEDDDDAPLPCTAEHVRALYEQDPDIFAQAIEFIEDRTRFFGHSLTRSVPTVTTSSG